MFPDEKIIALNLRSRPLRLAYLVTCLEDIKDAVNLYTHTWGGYANVLLSIHDDDEKIKQLHNSLVKFDPDYILFTNGREIPQKVKHILESYPAQSRPIHQQEIEKFTDSEDKIYLPVGNLNWSHQAKLPHIYSILKDLYRTPVNNSRLHLFETPISKFDLELSLQTGITSQSYRQYLIQHLGAIVIPSPQNDENFLKTSLCLSTSVVPASLTLTNLRIQQRSDWFDLGWQDEPLALCLFLYEEDNIDIAASFWNTRWFYSLNKLLFPKQEFLDNIKHYANLALSAIPSLKAIYIAANISRDEAQSLQSDIKSTISQIAGRDIAVYISYSNFYEGVRKVAIYTGSPKTTSQKVHSDDSIRFLPETPSGLETSDFAFGYDAELNLDPGNKLLFPISSEMSTLLSNSLKSIEYDEEQTRGLPSLSMRATDIGVAGISITGKECKLFIHPDSVIISRYLKSNANIEIKANRHTRYAEGFIKRLGGLKKIYSLVYKGGIETLLALCSQKSEQCGQETTGLTNFLRDKINIEHKKAQSIINEQLPTFLASSLVRRGMSLKCPVCDLETWYSLSSLGEFINCQGCLEKFQLENLEKYKFSYIPNELSRRLIENGGIAVLATASLFQISNPPSFIQFGGDLFEPRQKNNFAEIDLIAIAGDILAIAECKYFPKLDSEEQVQKALSSSDGLEKAIKVAERIGAQIVLLGVSTNLENSNQEIVESLDTGVAKLAEDAKAKGIGVYLKLTGSGVDSDPYRAAINLKDLIPVNTHDLRERGVGEQPSSFGGKINPFDEEILKTWKEQLSS